MIKNFLEKDFIQNNSNELIKIDYNNYNNTNIKINIPIINMKKSNYNLIENNDFINLRAILL